MFTTKDRMLFVSVSGEGLVGRCISSALIDKDRLTQAMGVCSGWPPSTALPMFVLVCLVSNISIPPVAFMLSTQLNPMAEDNRLAPNCICQLKRNVTNVLKDGRYGASIFLCFPTE